MSKRVFAYLFLLSSFVYCLGQSAVEMKELMQNHFLGGTIVSVTDDIACYRLKGNKNGGMYGYCKWDPEYTPLISLKTESWAKDKGHEEKILNSQCYTVIAPCFDYAQPFSEGWAAVCKNKKWAYVSKSGEFLCDFVLDAAYPFKNGKAKVKYLGTEYEINVKGEGLPAEVFANIHEENSKLAALTINQLVDEGQYEKAIEIGNDFLNNLLPSKKVSNLPVQDIAPIIRLIFATNSARNHLLAAFISKPDLVNTYRSMPIKRTFSYLDGSPSLLYYDFVDYYNLVKNNIEDSKIKGMIERTDYKYAVVRFEQTYLNSSDKEIGQNLKYLYYKLLALSGDFERVNMNAIYFAEKGDLSQVSSEYEKAVYLSELKQYEKALSLFKQILAKSSMSIMTGKCYHHMALIYTDLGMNDEAKNYFQSAIDTYDKEKAPSDLKLDAMVSLLTKIDNLEPSKYLQFFKKYRDEEIRYDLSLFSSLDTYELNKRWGLSLFRIEKVLSTIVNNNPKFKSCNPYAFELTIFEKSILQDAQSTWQQDANISNNELIKKKITAYSKLRKEFVGYNIFDLENDTVYESIKHMYELECEIKQMLYCDSLIVSPDKYSCWNSIKSALQLDEMAIEFSGHTDDNHIKKYGAWVVRNNATVPEYVEIIDSDLFYFYTKDFNNKTIKEIQNLFSSNLGELIWNKITDINKYSTIYFSPIRTLEVIGIENLPFGKSSLSEQMRVHRITSTSVIPHIKKNKNTIASIQLFGGLTYGNYLSSISRGSLHSGYLRYSKKEVDEIEKIMDGTCAIEKYVENQGSRNVFLNNANNSHSIIHLSTHGWQNEKPLNINFYMYKDRFDYYGQNSDLENEDWLLNSSGLRMSVKDNVTDSLENILFASDIAKIMLDNTVLVVLSACNTIDGGSNGISSGLGLNYALERANVKNVISSLWDVSDVKTYEFMTLFYKHLTLDKDANIFEAFRNTVMDMKEKYPNNPEIWSAFVLTEN